MNDYIRPQDCFSRWCTQNPVEDNARKWHIRQSVRALKRDETGVVVLPQRSYWEPIKEYVLAGLDILLEYGTLFSGDLEYITKEGTRILIRDDRQVILPSQHTIRWRM